MAMRSVAQDDSSDSVYNTLYCVFFCGQGVGINPPTNGV
jgi:hypothetical protein